MNKLRSASVIVTYRCNAKCHMCHTWKNPSKKSEEIGIDVYEKLPNLNSINITGGEPFLREDLDGIVKVLKAKANRIVISSNGFFTDKILELFKKHRDIGIRISIEGLPKSNDELRGIKDGFDRGLRSLLELDRMGIKDIGFGITASDRNVMDLLELSHLAKMMGVEFATAAIHNSFYFHKFDNKFNYPDVAIREFENLIKEQLSSRKAKDWFRAYFNYGIINYIKGNPRLLPCNMGVQSFFLDPYGEVLPCNVMEESMGNLEICTFEKIWQSRRAAEVRGKAKNCPNNCWMIGSVNQEIRKNLSTPLKWIIKHKFLKEQVK